MASNVTIYNDVFGSDHGSFLTLCLNTPPKINSDGIWEFVFGAARKLRFSPLPLLEFQMLLIFFVNIILHSFLRLFGLPLFVSQIITGLILGSSWRGSFESFDNFKDGVFATASQEIVGLLAGFGFSKTHGTADMEFIAAHQSYTSFAVMVCLLDHLKILNSEVGRLVLSTTIVADLVGLSFSLIITVIENVRSQGALNGLMTFAMAIGSLVLIVFLFRPAMLWIVRSTPSGRPVPDGYICIIILLVLVSSVTSNIMGRTVYSGPFILGLTVPEGPPLGASLVKKLDSIITSVFVPLFVTISVMKVDLSFLYYDGEFLIHSIIVIFISSIGKLAVSVGTALYFKMSSHDALAFGLIMCSKGIVELAACSYFYDSNLLYEQTFAVLIADILIFSILMPMVVKWFYDPSRKYSHYQKKNILNLKPDAELSILGCIHTQDGLPVLLNLLDASCPTEESPISLYALHLVELVGRATPVFITHELHEQKSSSEVMVSDSIIQMLRKYEMRNEGVVSIEVFTAIAPMKLMHDDICTVAVNKLTSIIILPFHRRWTREGFVDSEDSTIRALNCQVLERAPCSVGILIDRGHLSSYRSFGGSCASLLQVAMVFLGGQDDREAFSFARRMVKEVSSAQLTVIRLIAEDESISHWEMVLDTELLNDVKHSFVGGEPFRYVERRADEGSETATIIRSIGDEYDLIIVGRREGIDSPQTSGLMEWNEFPELGIIGDMLASADSHFKASTLVVQQQQQWSFYKQ
ncbi:hypothetical protein Csa_008150 [Cucumis sativus]|nr:hypothetical protein Csa_008150 [Cucumis sativus]